MKKAGLYGTREFFGLTEVLRSDQKNIQALFGRYLVSPRSLRLAIVDGIIWALERLERRASNPKYPRERTDPQCPHVRHMTGETAMEQTVIRGESRRFCRFGMDSHDLSKTIN